MNPSSWLLIGSTLVTLYVFGQIWLVQLVVYPHNSGESSLWFDE